MLCTEQICSCNTERDCLVIGGNSLDVNALVTDLAGFSHADVVQDNLRIITVLSSLGSNNDEPCVSLRGFGPTTTRLLPPSITFT